MSPIGASTMSRTLSTRHSAHLRTQPDRVYLCREVQRRLPAASLNAGKPQPPQGSQQSTNGTATPQPPGGAQQTGSQARRGAPVPAEHAQHSSATSAPPQQRAYPAGSGLPARPTPAPSPQRVSAAQPTDRAQPIPFADQRLPHPPPQSPRMQQPWALPHQAEQSDTAYESVDENPSLGRPSSLTSPGMPHQQFCATLPGASKRGVLHSAAVLA